MQAQQDTVPVLKAVMFSVTDAEATEGTDATLDFVVTLLHPVRDTVTVDYATSDGTATAGADYTATSGTLTFEPGFYADLERTIAVPIMDDSVPDDRETFTLTLTNATGFTTNPVADAVGTGTIRNTEPDPLKVSVSDTSATEGDAAEFTVSLSATSSQQVTVQYATSSGSAESGTDFTAATGTVTFAVGETLKTVNVATTVDSADEVDETFSLTLSSPTNATLGDATATGTINDDDAPPTVGASDASAIEGDAVEFAVSLSAASGQQVTVQYATSSGTATSGTDFTAASGTLTFASGETSKTVSVATTEDSAGEADETFTLTLSSPTNATLGDATATGTINDKPPPTVGVSDASAIEGDAIEFAVSLSAASGQQVTVQYATSSGTAESGTDFTAASGTLTFAAGETSKTVSVATTNDAANEGDETFTFTLSNVSGATIADGQATGAIRDREPAVPSTDTLWSADMSVTDFGNGSIGAWGTDKFSNVGGSANLEAKWLWYATGDRKLHLAFTTALPNTTGLSLYMGDVAVAFPDDGGDSSFSWTDVDVAWADGDTLPVQIIRGGAVVPPVTTPPTVSVSDASATEGDAVEFTVSLSAASGQQVTVEYATSGGTATSATDFTAASGTVTFAANETSKTVSVATTDDSVDEEDETFTLTLSSPVNATLGDATATGTISDDDGPPAVSVSDASATEGDAVEFTVSLSAASGQQVTAQYATSGGTATSGTDFTAASGTLTFAAGETSQTMSVATTDDEGDEEDETFTLTLSSPANATLGDATATGTISDDDEPPAVSVSDASATEGDAVEFTVSLSAASGQQVTVEYATSGGTATSGTDFTAASGTLTFAAGETSQTMSVATTDDEGDEEDETFTLTLSSPANATLGDATATGTISDDDGPPTVSVSDASATEGDAVEFTVSLSAASGQQVTVEYASSGGTATSGTDFTAASGTVTFAAGETSQTVSVATTDDSVDEEDETFTLTLSSPTNATLGDATATGTIEDDDSPPVLSVSDASAAEGDAVEFTVSLSAASAQQVTVRYATSGGTATSGTDFTAESGTLTFAANESSKTVNVATTDDSVDEEDETFTLTLSSPANAALGDAAATGTINDNDVSTTPLTASFRNMPASHTGEEFTFGLAFSEDVELSYVTLRDTAFVVTGGEVKTAQRQQQGSNQAWNITVEPSGQGDVTIVLPETTDCSAVDAICTIDERPLSHSLSSVVAGPVIIPAVSASDASAAEGDAVAFTVSLSVASGRQVTVAYATSGGTATSGTDFTAESGTLTFAANETSKTVSVATTDDSVDEDDETFTLTLSSPANATLGDATATGTINDDDETLPALSVSDASAAEGDAVTFSVSLSPASGEQVTVEYATSGGTATSGTDFTAESGTMIFSASETSKTVSVGTTDDSVDEDNETFTLTLSSPANATLGDATATGTINDDDETLPALSVSDASAAEGDAVAFTVSLSPASSQQVTVQYTTSGGTATSGTDFTAESGTLTFAASETSKTVGIATTEDTMDEDDETFTLTLSSPANATLADGTATGTILDDDDAAPLTASFSNMPASHTGGEFTFGLAFSENVELSYVTLRDTAFVVTGGEVKRAQRQQQGSNQAWNITVEPVSANDTVTITLPETTDCNAVDAICTHDGRPLSHSLSATVAPAASATAGDAANGDVVVDDDLDDALALVDGVTPDEAVAALVGEATLSEAQLNALDRLGNRNGLYDLGDVLSWRDRCGSGEARCGGSTAPGPASSAFFLFGAAAAGRRRTPRSARRRGSGRRPARRGACALALLVAASASWSCTGDLVGPPAAERDPAPHLPAPATAPRGPGLLTVEWTAPAAGRAIGVLLELEGPGIEAVVGAAGTQVYHFAASGRQRIVVAGPLESGPLLRFRVPDRGQLPLYRVRVLQVTEEDYRLGDTGEYRAVASPN